MNVKPLNQAAVEIARILLEFEVEQRKTAESLRVSEAQSFPTAIRPAAKATRRVNSTTRAGIRKTEGEL